jgi:branched-chain amino acid transport system substrate-binding protein
LTLPSPAGRLRCDFQAPEEADDLRKNQVPTVIGRLRFDGPNNYGDDLSKVKQAQDGKWIVVWPREFAAPNTRLLPP